jgi:hypothetical protein
MRRFRFTIAGLLGLVLFLGVGFAALREASELWDSAVFSTTVGMLSASVLLAVHRADRRRAFWLGFALFGWISLGASLIPSIESQLLTTRVLTFLDSKMPGRAPATITWVAQSGPGNAPQTLSLSLDGNTLSLIPPGAPVNWNTSITGCLTGRSSGTTESFLRIGHSLVALVLAYLGGHLSRGLSDRGRRVIGGAVSPTHPVPGALAE